MPNFIRIIFSLICDLLQIKHKLTFKAFIIIVDNKLWAVEKDLLVT